MPRPSNPELCAAFRQLLTHGFYAHDDDGVVIDGDGHAAMLDATKSWRAELWKAFRPIEDRLCPVQAFERTHR